MVRRVEEKEEVLEKARGVGHGKGAKCMIL